MLTVDLATTLSALMLPLDGGTFPKGSRNLVPSMDYFFLLMNEAIELGLFPEGIKSLRGFNWLDPFDLPLTDEVTSMFSLL
jgi:hypothetical protein